MADIQHRSERIERDGFLARLIEIEYEESGRRRVLVSVRRVGAVDSIGHARCDSMAAARRAALAAIAKFAAEGK